MSQFVRQELVWRAWFNAIAASSEPGIVPGSSTTGIGWFLRTLASGTVNYQTLPGSYTDADHYVVQIHQPLDGPLRSLVIAAALALDISLKQTR